MGACDKVSVRLYTVCINSRVRIIIISYFNDLWLITAAVLANDYDDDNEAAAAVAEAAQRCGSVINAHNTYNIITHVYLRVMKRLEG